MNGAVDGPAAGAGVISLLMSTTSVAASTDVLVGFVASTAASATAATAATVAGLALSKSTSSSAPLLRVMTPLTNPSKPRAVAYGRVGNTRDGWKGCR